MRIAGLASGMDVNDMINQLMRAERMSMDKLFQQRQWLDWQRDSYRDVNLAISKFRDAQSNMRLQSTFIALQATSSNPNALRATATANAQSGSYTFNVEQIAKRAEINSANRITTTGGENVSSTTNVFAAMGRDAEEGTFNLSLEVANSNGTNTVNIEVRSTDTFSTLSQRISRATYENENGDQVSLGLQASFDNTLGRFFISTRETGENKSITLSDTDVQFVDKFINGVEGATGSLTGTGQNARVTLDGVNEVIESATNQISVRGLNLNVMQTGTATVNVQSNPDDVFNKIKGFVDAYNELLDDLNGRLNEPRYRGYPPLTDEQKQAMTEREIEMWEERAQSGTLRNDPILRNLLTTMRQHFTNPIDGIPSGELRHLSEIGITTSRDWRNGGRLEINETKLRNAISEKPEEVMNLFTKSTGDTRNESGVGRRVYQEMDDALRQLRRRAGSPGVIGADQSTIGRQLRQVDSQIQRWEDRLVRIEERYWRQFTAMEKAMSEMNNQSMFLMQNLLQMPGM